MQALSLSFSVLFVFSTFSTDAATNKLPKGFSIDLIHRDSPLSPFYNSSITHKERIQNAVLRSMSRANLFRQSAAETDIIPNGGNYLMKFFIGTPPVERWAEADTGSDLIWVQCSPCTQCYPQNAPLYDPKGSSTYMGLPCNSNPCAALSNSYCGSSNECSYDYRYLDMSYTKGELATESISFGTSGGGQAVSFPKSVFGCGHINGGKFNKRMAGLVGLGRGSLSLVSQIGNLGWKFSYCLPPFYVNATTKLRFGDEATISANGIVSTPLIGTPDSMNSYFLNLEGITIGQQRVEIGQSNINGNTVIDSGTTLTFLPSAIYDQVEALVKKAIGADQSIVQNPQLNLCYTNVGSIKNVPNFEVHFKGATLSLKPQNIFVRTDNDVVCFAMAPIDLDGLSIYGNVAQADFDVEYDLDQKKVSFAPVDCTKQ